MEISRLSRNILMDLCTDSRITVTALSKKYNISRKSARDRIAALESELGLQYTLELDHEKLKLASLHILRLRFNKRPNPGELKGIFAHSRIVQFAATTKGGFDMIIMALARDSREYFKWEIGLWTTMAKYGVESHSSEVIVQHLGFVPLNDETLKECKVDETYKKILLCLNRNSRMTLRDLSKQIGMSEGLTKYYMKKLDMQKLIKRFTAVATIPPLKCNIVYFANYVVKEGVEARAERERRTMYWKRLQEPPVISEFQFMWSMTGSDAAFVWASYDDYETGIKTSVETHNSIYRADSPKVVHAVVESTVKGVFPLRALDTKANYDTTMGASMA